MLIVEDEAIIALDLKFHLEDLGYKVIAWVDSGEKALEVVEQDPPDLVFMDIILKGAMDGIEAANRIRFDKGIPVIFVTAYADQERLDRAKLTYPFGYLLKPFEDRDIKITIQMAFYFSKMEQENKKAFQKLKESEQRYHSIFEQSNDGIALIKGNKYLEVNQRMVEIFSYEGPEEIIGQPLSLLVDPEDLNRLEELNRKRQNGLPVLVNYEMRGIQKDGRRRVVEVSASRIENQNQTVSLVHIRDITEQKLAEEEHAKFEKQLRLSEKMEAVGNLTKVIARDFSVILMGMQDHVSTALEKMDPSFPGVDHFRAVEEFIRNGLDLVRHLPDYHKNENDALKNFENSIPGPNQEIPTENEFGGKLVKGEGTILLVDDEAMILEVQKELLRGLGYEVLIASSGKEAIAIYRKNMDRIRLVILDVVMPQMSGGEIFDQLMLINPQVKILLTSGYNIIGQIQEILNRGCQGFIEKPFELNKLSQTISKILGKF